MDGKTALVTGGGSGIGLATARLLLERGANVALVGRNARRLNEAIDKLGVSDGRVKALPGDVSSEGYANKLVVEAKKAFGGLHILVNNAGVFRLSSIFDTFEEDYDEVMRVNLKGTWLMCKSAARLMRENGGGSIVNVSSLLAVRAARTFQSSAYSAAKAGVLGLTRELAIELAPFKIRVNAVLPALVRTPMLHSVGDQENVDRLVEESKRIHPLGRIGEPEDVARAIVFLADPANDWLTGTELFVDGGRAVL
jgi:NAD(P)-dependent dehydrogenase (short-subunit alcohol dehydrogenase family)